VKLASLNQTLMEFLSGEPNDWPIERSSGRLGLSFFLNQDINELN